jgi:hypothetical protein
MMMTLVGNHDGDPRFGGVYVALVGSQGGWVCPRDGRVPWRSTRVFVLVFDWFFANNTIILFFLINENGKSFASFQKKGSHISKGKAAASTLSPLLLVSSKALDLSL